MTLGSVLKDYGLNYVCMLASFHKPTLPASPNFGLFFFGE